MDGAAPDIFVPSDVNRFHWSPSDDVYQVGLLALSLVAGRVVSDPAPLLAELGLEGHVEHVGRYPQRDAPELYRRAHLLLHTKVNDPCPNVVLEALACGVPVVHSASGGTPELVGEAGVAVPSETTWEEDWTSAAAKSAALPERFRAVAAEGGFELIDLGEVTRFSHLDGIHLDAEGHAAVAKLVERTLRRLF